MLETIEILGVPLLALVSFMYLVNVILRHTHETLVEQPLLGALFGGAACLCMAFPINVAEGVIVDARGIAIAAASALAGPIAGVVAVAMAIAYRSYIGGLGLLSGIVGLCVAFAAGYIWRVAISPYVRPVFLADLLLGVVASFALVGLFLLPPEIYQSVFRNAAAYVVAVNIFAALLIGYLFRREVGFYQAAVRLRENAHYDPLTRLLNRRGAEERIAKMKYSHLNGQGLFFFDVDKFKDINDTHGHRAGDEALSVIADRIQGTIRDEAVVMRQGGDEFAVYMPDIPEIAMSPIAQRFCDVIARSPMAYAGKDVTLSISVGAYFTRQRISLDDLQEKADAELYRAKEAGRGRPSVAFDGDDQDANLRENGKLVYLG